MLSATSNAGELAKRHARRQTVFLSELADAIEASQATMLRSAVNLSSGPYKTAWLRQQARRRGAGLYSVRNPAPPADPAIINRQTGKFAAGWQSRILVSDKAASIVLFNVTPYGKYMRGTALMIPRPTLERLEEAEWPFFFQRIALANRRAMMVE